MTLVFQPRDDVLSWGRAHRGRQSLGRPADASELRAWAAVDKGPRLARGLGRSYGDSGLHAEGRLIDMTGLDRFRSFDAKTGLLRAQAGLSLDTLLKVTAPQGWFVPVTPGTRHVTLGGAVAHDVHGKNHSWAGTFGRHVRALSLLRSDRGLIEITPQSDPELFAATVGGMGLTGLIVEVTLQLTAIASTDLVVETLPLGGLDDFFALNLQSLERFEQTVAWIDCAQRGSKLGLGVYTRANWATDGGCVAQGDRRGPSLPFEAPSFALNRVSLSLFNQAYRAVQLARPRRARLAYGDVFYPLDAVQNWNRLYGRSGFYQYQSVVPHQGGREALADMLRIIGRSGEGSPLVVLKSFGTLASPGMLSFPRPGYTLALDFRNRGQATQALLARLDAVVRAAKGALYPAKDGRMPRDMFALSFPQAQRFLTYRDPACGSDFLTRMGL